MINFSLNKKHELAQQLGLALLESEATVASVESCTGGGFAYAITEVAGSSQWFNQSWVTYSNAAKEKLVNVPAQILDENGAVSEPVVKRMAENGAKLANADYCVAISGVAGPSGGTEQKPVGLVWFASSGPGVIQTLTFSRRFSGDRKEVREQAIVVAFEKLISCLTN